MFLIILFGIFLMYFEDVKYLFLLEIFLGIIFVILVVFFYLFGNCKMMEVCDNRFNIF